MSIEEFNIYLAKGKSLEMATSHFAAREAAQDARREHAIRRGGPNAKPYGTDFTYEGICTPDTPDAKLWRTPPASRSQPQDAPHPCYIPNIKTKEGKALEAEMGNSYSGHGFHKTFSLPGNEVYSEGIGLSMETGGAPGQAGLVLLYARVGKIGEKVVILVPKQMKEQAPPPDAEKIQLSRYFALLEAEEGRL